MSKFHTTHRNCAGKEYAQADSRYATRDSFVISMEAVTAFVEGPACFAVVYAILHRRPWAYTVQLLVSLGQIYGDVLYFSTTVLEGETWSTYSGFAKQCFHSRV